MEKIDKAKLDGYHVEALLNKYILVVDLLNFVSLKINPSNHSLNVKAKDNVRALGLSLAKNASARSVINKKNLKSVKLWIGKMDTYLKTYRIKRPGGTASLLQEGEKVFTLLNVAAQKLVATSVKNKRRI
jgi:hypothetical protein